MTENLNGHTIAFVATNGVEQDELTAPWNAVKEAGATPVLVSDKEDSITAMHGDWEHGDSFPVDRHISEAKAEDFDSLVLPGGTLNADTLRTNEDVLNFVRDFFSAKKPVASICHGPWLLINAGVVDGRTMTSVDKISIDLKNAGAKWVDQEVVVDNGLTTSRNPGDLEAFNAKLIEEAAEGKHSKQTT